MKAKKNPLLLVAALLCGLIALLVLLYFCDNKYQTPPPYGENGVITLSEGDLGGDRAIFLIDGWLLTDARVKDLPTYIGEFSNLQRGDYGAAPHGAATYTLTLRYCGAPMLVAVSFPRLSTDFVLTLDGTALAHDAGNGSAIFYLEPGDHALTVETTSTGGYYSGMYFPPSIGRPDVLSDIRNTQTLVYSLAICVCLLLALFTLVLWRDDCYSMAFCLGVLCCFFSLYLSHYFVELFRLPLLQAWQVVEGFALYGLIFCVVRLTALAVGEAERRWFVIVQRAMWIVPLLLGGLYLLISVFPWAVRAHGAAKDLYLIFVFCCVVFLTTRAALRHSVEAPYLLAGGVVFGVGLISNLLFANQFEPIRFFWQFEWCGLLLACLFAAMMVARNKQMLKDNDELTNHLERQVLARTEELRLLLRERKEFFSDMAHDLKAPLRSTQTFIRAIRQNNTGVDGELLRYIDQVEQKQQEMSRRVQGLNTITRLDKIDDSPQRVFVRELLEELYATHNGEAEVCSIHLSVAPPEEDCWIVAQPEKLDILFENLIYNAMHATPAEGHITLAAKKKPTTVVITVADTGCGISAEELPHIFRRFYVGENNKETGSGLGLYISKTIVEELGGTISATSAVGEGTVFSIEIPLARTRKTDREQ